MAVIPLQIVPKPDSTKTTVYHKTENIDEPYFRFGGPDSFSCGQCGTILVDKIQQGQITGVYFECPKCDDYNYLP